MTTIIEKNIEKLSSSDLFPTETKFIPCSSIQYHDNETDYNVGSLQEFIAYYMALQHKVMQTSTSIHFPSILVGETSISTYFPGDDTIIQLFFETDDETTISSLFE